MTALTDYERQRLENIRKNQSLLSSLAIKSIGPPSTKQKQKKTSQNSRVEVTTSTTSTPTSSKKRTRSSHLSESSVPPKRHATRASVRLNGTGLLTPEVLESHSQKLEQVTEDEKKKRNQLRHSDRKFMVESWSMSAKGSKNDTNSNLLLTDQFFKSITSNHGHQPSEQPGGSPIKTMKQEEVNVEYSPGNDDDYDRLSNQLNNLKLKSVNKVCPHRIYSMAFHPDPAKSLIFIGEKLGGIGIWDALGTSTTATTNQVKTEDVKDEQPNSAGEEEEEEEEEPEFLQGTSCFIQVHTHYSPISSIQTHPTHPHLIYTSSYDESIRELNFETKDSIEILNGNEINPNGDTLFSNFEFINSGREIWASDNDGGLSHRDLRLPKSVSSKRWLISKKKIGCLSICPNSDDRLAVTAGLNREMRLWDLRALSGLPTDSEISDVETKSCLANYAHNLACSSAFFNHSGDKILSTSYDDLVRIWEFDQPTRSSWLNHENNNGLLHLKPTYKARHDNQTGRWVSVFKARWCPNPRFPCHFTIGNMSQKLDVYNPKGELLSQLKHYSLTTVPAVTAQHPSSSSLQIAGATAGGKVYLWS